MFKLQRKIPYFSVWLYVGEIMQQSCAFNNIGVNWFMRAGHPRESQFEYLFRRWIDNI